jgi:8-amino-7-oxononanoate synthase
VPETIRNSLRARMSEELEALREDSQLRALDHLGGINLCSNDYLGLACDARLKQAVIASVGNTYAMGSTGSRLLSGNAPEWEELETEFAVFAGTEAALYFGSGYAANVGLLSSLLKPGDTVFSDALNHASLIDGMRLSGAHKVIYPHGDMQFLESALRERMGNAGAKLIVTESVFSMEGDVAPLETLVRLARKYDAELVIDEAHATGVCGPEGRGVAAELGFEREILAIVHTCGKALASAGAFVCCGSELRNYLVNRARTFIFSTAMPPYIAGQIRAALAIARSADDRRTHLRQLATALREKLSAAGIGTAPSTTHIIPVFLGGNEAALHVAAELQASGFAVKAIRPPTVPAGTARVRISLTSRITMEEIDRLADVIVRAEKSLALPNSASAVHA